MHTLSLALVLLAANAPAEGASRTAPTTEAQLDEDRALAARDRDRKEEDDEEKLGFFDKYYTLTFDDEYHPDVEKDLFLLYVLEVVGVLSWGSTEFIGFTPSLQFRDEYAGITMIHFMTMIPFIYLWWVPIIGWFGVPIWFAVNIYYLIPAAALNAYNRDYVRQRGAGDDDGGRRRPSGDGTSAALPRPPSVASADETLVAY
mgnify:CR=1 FL=1